MASGWWIIRWPGSQSQLLYERKNQIIAIRLNLTQVTTPQVAAATCAVLYTIGGRLQTFYRKIVTKKGECWYVPTFRGMGAERHGDAEIGDTLTETVPNPQLSADPCALCFSRRPWNLFSFALSAASPISPGAAPAPYPKAVPAARTPALYKALAKLALLNRVIGGAPALR